MMHGLGFSIYRRTEAKKEQAKEFIYRLPDP